MVVFLLGGLKYQDSMVRTRRNAAGNSSAAGCSTAKCEKIAPVNRKKMPAYVHSLTNAYLGISRATTPNNFQTPIKVNT